MAREATKQTCPVRCIVKLGGAAITNKNELESINEESLRSACAQLWGTMSAAIALVKVLGMDWSRRHRNPAAPVVAAEEFVEQAGLGLNTSFIVVHGAGSFGHFQASRSGVHKRGLHSTTVKAGFAATRISVTSLNQEIVTALVREGIPSVGLSPFACGWTTRQRNVRSKFESAFVNFKTDVHGVYDRPPTEPNAVLLREIVEITVAAHDTTAGMEAKISEAAMIAKLGIDVYITKVGAEHSFRALKGDVHVGSEDWLGTLIRSSK